MSISGAIISKSIIYREPVRLATVSGLIIATSTSILAAGVPTLTDADHVHIVVFSPYVSGPQNTGNAAVSTVTGMYQVWNVPYWALAPKVTYASQPAGSWTWPF